RQPEDVAREGHQHDRAGRVFHAIAPLHVAVELVRPVAHLLERRPAGHLDRGLPGLLGGIVGHARFSSPRYGSASSALMRWMRTATAGADRPVTSPISAAVRSSR